MVVMARRSTDELRCINETTALNCETPLKHSREPLAMPPRQPQIIVLTSHLEPELPLARTVML